MKERKKRKKEKEERKGRKKKERKGRNGWLENTQKSKKEVKSRFLVIFHT